MNAESENLQVVRPEQPGEALPAAGPSVIVIGAGPAGLSLGYQLEQRGIDYLILEKGLTPATSFQEMPRSIFYGPWIVNDLYGLRMPWTHWFRRTRRKEFVDYLLRYAQEHRLKIRTGVTVSDVTREDERFQVHTDHGLLECGTLVNAAGYYSTPFTPGYPGQSTTSIRQMHVRDYREPADVADRIGSERGRLLIVGKRVSAGETLVELHQAGFQVSLSVRSKLKFGPSHLLQTLYAPFVMTLEQLGAWLRFKTNSYPRMVGGESERLVREGKVPVLPDIREFREDRVLFSDGQEQHFDLVIYTTGYRPTVAHLEGLGATPSPRTGYPRLHEMESIEVPGLFFLGFDNERSFRSRYLRGMREDSVPLARKIEARVRSMPVR